MATISTTAQPVKLTIPAAYLDDARIAACREVNSDNGALRGEAQLEDRVASVRILTRSVRLLEELYAADGDTELTGKHDRTSAPLMHLLEEIVDLWTQRLRDVAQFRPLPMGDILELAARLRWAAGEAIRIEPDSDHRLGLSDWQHIETGR